jgi:hypothetical protein
MKRHIPPAIAFKELDSMRGERFHRGQYIGGFRVSAKRDYRRMLEQQQHITNLAGLAQIDQPPLQAKPFAIINLSELDDGNHVMIKL